jgi:uridine monophosphate synthetase
MTFFTRLVSRIKQVDSLLCVGLDPHPEDLEESTPEAAFSFCMQLIDALADLTAAFKPNSAFFEALGPEGLQVLKDVIDYVPDDIPVILDAKRGDISSTAMAYAKAVYQILGADAVTINPYLGYDAVQPFLSDPEKGVFLLCKTSNPGAKDIQDLSVASQGINATSDNAGEEKIPVYIEVAKLAKMWNKSDNLGLVVGATQPDSLARLRAVTPDNWFLAPGIGAQGGDLKDALHAGLRPDGLGMLIPVSRGISRAKDPQQTAEALRSEINVLRKQLAGRSGTIPVRLDGPLPVTTGKLAEGLLQAGCIKFGTFTLKSGIQSPIYIDMRRLVGFPGLLSQVAKGYLPFLNHLEFDHLAALPYAALPIATEIGQQGGWSMVYPRKEVKGYGTKARVEGVFNPGDRVVVIDDLISTGESKFEGIEKLTAAGLQVKDIVVLIDRSPDCGTALSQRGFRLHAVLTLHQLLDYYQWSSVVDALLIQSARDFLESQQ